MVRCTDCSSFLSYRTQKVLNNGFNKLGQSTYRHPWLYLIIGFLLTVICGTGILFIEQESAIINLWVPTEASITKDSRFVENAFGTSATSMSVLLVGKNGVNIMTPDALEEGANILSTIYSLNITHNDDIYTYHDLCERSDISSPYCATDIMNLWTLFFENNRAYYTSEEYISTVLNTDGVSNFVGSMKHNNNNNNSVSEANIIRVYWALSSTTDTDLSDIQTKFHYAWMDYWALHVNDYKYFNVMYMGYYSFDVEIARTVTNDSLMFMIAFGVMLVYLQLTLGKLDCIRARVLLATTSIFILILALIMGFGLAAYCGAKLSTLVFVVPFLLLGVGVDDMIIIVDSLNHTKLPQNDENFRAQQLGLALQHSGISITLTSACSVIAFCAGAISDLPGVQFFCIYAAFSFLANYILQFLMFVPLLVWDNKRIKNGGNFCCCCCYKHDINHEQHDEQHDTDAPPKRFSLNWCLNLTLIAVLSKRIGRWIIIILFIIFVAVSGYLSTQVDAISDPSMLTPDDSYIKDYLKYSKIGWSGLKSSQIEIIFKNVDFSDIVIRDNIFKMMEAFESDETVIGQVENWIEPFEQYLKDEKGINDITTAAIQSNDYYIYLKEFEQKSEFNHWDDELIFDDDNNPTYIITTKFYFNAMVETDDIESYKKRDYYNNIFYTYFSIDDGMVYYEQWVYNFFAYSLRSLAFYNLLSSTIAVFIVLVILMDIRVALFVIIIIIFIDSSIFGWMYITGTDIQIISFCQLCMAVGLTVDYVIHMTHAVAEMKVDSNNYAMRVKYAMIETGGSVIKGAATTFIGASVLIFSGSVAFRQFFNMLAGIIIVAVLFGLVFAPAVMGEFKFIYSGLSTLEDNKTNVEYAGVATEESQSEYDDSSVI